MFPQPTTQQVKWQDLHVISDVDLVLKIAQLDGWTDCRIFGYGDMIAQPLESLGWKLIPADLYEYSIPAEGVDRILQIINAGVNIKGVIIADDLRSKVSSHGLNKPKTSLPSGKTILSMVGRVFLGLIFVCIILLTIACTIFFAPMLLLGAIFGSSGYIYDPQLLILIDEGNGELAWISVFTWFD